MKLETFITASVVLHRPLFVVMYVLSMGTSTPLVQSSDFSKVSDHHGALAAVAVTGATR